MVDCVQFRSERFSNEGLARRFVFRCGGQGRGRVDFCLIEGEEEGVV